MDAGVVAALVTAAASTVLAIIGLVSSARTQQRAQHAAERLAGQQAAADERLAALQSRLDAVRSRDDARLDYEYEARKRLYAAVEPLLFLLADRSRDAVSRIRGLARTTRQGQLEWLGKEGYFYANTLYRLLAPLAVAELIRRELTSVDLSLDRDLLAQYRIAELLERSFRDDHQLAMIEPSVPYHPDRSPSGHGDERGNPPELRRQGVYAGWLKSSVSALIVPGPPWVERETLMSFGEFEDLLGAGAGPRVGPLSDLRYLFTDFDPREHRVLWRALIVQAHLYEAVLRVHDARARGEPAPRQPIEPIQGDERTAFALTLAEERARAVDPDPFDAAVRYLDDQIGDLVAVGGSRPSRAGGGG